MPKKVVILGGGIGGLSAAHELLERGFDVEVFEQRDALGGKARSMPVPFTNSTRNIGTVNQGRIGLSRRMGLPGEHGFRFFPRFYRHLPDTMGRIPYGPGTTVRDNLVETTKIALTRFGRSPLVLPSRFPRTLPDLYTLLDDFLRLLDPSFGISWEEQTFFAGRIWQILTSCDERRLDEYEKIGWWDFVQAEGRSDGYQKLYALGITRSLVASQARVASTKTIGDIFVQLLFDILEPGISSDSVLNGPTSEVWIDPWVDYLQRRGGRFHFRSRVLGLNVSNGRIKNVTVQQDRQVREVEGDYYVAALPVEVMASLITADLLRVDASLENILPLSKNVAWMNGIQLYLTEDVPITPGHVILLDSPWALTCISQRQFWQGMDLSQYGDGQIRGIISVDISEWNAPGLNGKSARECSREEIKNEVWQELKLSLNVDGRDVIRDEHLNSWFLDPDVNPATGTNSEPLLVNLVNSWRLRPEATTAIPNLFLASDYVRTYTDLATMEGANEAARRAVNGIIRDSNQAVPLCSIWKLQDPAFLELFRGADRERYRQGMPWDSRLETVASPAVRAAGEMARRTAKPLADFLEVAGIRNRPPQNMRRATGVLNQLASLSEKDAPGASEILRDISSMAGEFLTRVATRGSASAPQSTPYEPAASAPARPRPQRTSSAGVSPVGEAIERAAGSLHGLLQGAETRYRRAEMARRGRRWLNQITGKSQQEAPKGSQTLRDLSSLAETTISRLLSLGYGEPRTTTSATPDRTGSDHEPGTPHNTGQGSGQAENAPAENGGGVRFIQR